MKTFNTIFPPGNRKVMLSIAVVVVTVSVFFTSQCANVPDARWYKGNTHTHTVLCGHADTSPEAVTQWYHDRGYNFLILSEHNIYIDPMKVKMPENKRSDFILIPGEEVTGNKVVHTTAMNIDGLVQWELENEPTSAVIQYHVDGTVDAGGIPILNHPNFHYAVKVSDMLPIKRLHLFELYNGHPSVNNHGDHEHPSTEQMWDELLTAGMLIYGVSSDDAHIFQQWDAKQSNPGRGWVMVQAEELTPDAITDAMRNGNFYASNGVILKTLKVRDNTFEVEVDEEATQKELSSEILYGKHVEQGEPGYSIDFIGPDGVIVHSVKDVSATFKVPDTKSYVRCKITFRRNNGQYIEEFYAWTQPVFTDQRIEKILASE